MPDTADEEYSTGLSERDLQKLKDFIGSTETLAPEVQMTLEAGRYRVQSGDTLSGIFSRFYKNTNVNKEVLQAVFVKTNKAAFRRGKAPKCSVVQLRTASQRACHSKTLSGTRLILSCFSMESCSLLSTVYVCAITHLSVACHP